MRCRFLPLLTLLFVACAPMVWTKPGASQNDFSRDKYTCIQQAQQRVSTTRVTAYSGSADSGVITNENVYNSCMNANGWYLKTQESAHQQQQQVQSQQQVQQSNQQQLQQQRNQRFKETLDQISKENRDACDKEDFKVIYLKSSCKAEEISLDQLSDANRISSVERAAFLTIHSQSKARNKRSAANYRATGDAKGFSLAALLEKLDTMTEENALALYEGTISWGQYNKRKKEISQLARTEYAEIMRPK